MPSPLDDDPSVEPLYHDDRPDDVVIQYSKSNLMDEEVEDKSSLFDSVRRIEVTIIEERSDEIEAHLEVMDNTNKGEYALAGSTTNFSPKDQHEEFSERVVFEKSELPYYQDDFPNIESHVPVGERITPKVKEWSQDQPFRA
jgi:hypothetical protein